MCKAASHPSTPFIQCMFKSDGDFCPLHKAMKNPTLYKTFETKYKNTYVERPANKYIAKVVKY